MRKHSMNKYELAKLRLDGSSDGLCNCTCGDVCPFGKVGSEARCTTEQLNRFVGQYDLRTAMVMRIILAIIGLVWLIAFCALGQTPPMPVPPVDTNAVQVGQVAVEWNSVLGLDQAVMWYGLYAGTNASNLVSTVIVGADETNCTVPLFNYGTNWIAATSIDSTLDESLQCTPVTFTLVCKPVTNVITVTTRGPYAWSQDFVTWNYTNVASSIIIMTNPPAWMFWKGSNITISRITL